MRLARICKNSRRISGLAFGTILVMSLAVWAAPAQAQQTVIIPIIYQYVHIQQPAVFSDTGQPYGTPYGTYFGQPTRTIRTTSTTRGTFYRQVPVPGPIIRTSTTGGRYYIQPPFAPRGFSNHYVPDTYISPDGYGKPYHRPVPVYAYNWAS